MSTQTQITLDKVMSSPNSKVNWVVHFSAATLKSKLHGVK